MNIKQQLDIILENLALKSKNELFEISKIQFDPNWERCVHTETVFITIDKKARKYKLLSYDLYPCYRLVKVNNSDSVKLTFRLNEEGYKLLDEAMGEFYDNYCEKFAFPSKHYSNMNQGMRVFKIHANFLASQLTPLITEFCKKNRIPFQ
jgi:hypothetical protein